MQSFPEDPSQEAPEVDEEWTPESWAPYTYDDFQTHFRDHIHRRFEKTGEDEGAFVRNVLRLKRYFDEFYEEPHSIRNHGSFTLALTHISEFSEEYDSELFGIADNDGLWVSEGLLRAVHWYFAILPRSEWGSNDEALSRIKEWARNWIAENNKSEQGVAGQPA